jgi:hypothetical protein
MEEFAAWSAEVGVNDPAYKIPASLQNFSRSRIREHFYQAFSLAISRDQQQKEIPSSGLESLVSYEAGKGFVRLADDGTAEILRERPWMDRNEARRGELSKEEISQEEEIKASLAKFDKLPLGTVTPVIFSNTAAASIHELIAPGVTVDFNLRGYGTKDRWPWVKATTGFLVWDPGQTGSITSGQQMFGSYTFQIFWRNGYDALRSLDDNHDGMLSGKELEGLAVWFNSNCDGRCKPGEVVPVQDLGITGVSVEAPANESPHPMNPHGIFFSDGHSVPTWDWTAEPVEDAGGR